MKAKHRQRQGRDFITPDNPLRTAEMSLEGNYNMIDGILNNGTEKTTDERKKESIMQRIEQYKAEAERNGAPVDGHEPPERTL